MKPTLAILAVFVLGAASSYIYDHEPPEKELSTAQAVAIFNEFKTVGAWDLTPGEARMCVLRVAPEFEKGYGARCYGDKTVPNDMLPEGAKNVRVIN